MSIAQERCFNHAFREAVARCPECGRTFCRECISEHDDRVICAFCLKRLSKKAVRRNRLAGLVRLAQILMGVLLLCGAKGTFIDVVATGNGSADAVHAIGALIAARFGEAE